MNIKKKSEIKNFAGDVQKKKNEVRSWDFCVRDNNNSKNDLPTFVIIKDNT